jgi:hypothetical protein
MYTEKIGWETNRRTRQLLLDDMVWALRSHTIRIPSMRLLDEMMKYDVLRPIGDTSDEVHDDLCDAAMIAYHTHLNCQRRDGTFPHRYRDVPAHDPEPKKADSAMTAAAWQGWDKFTSEKRKDRDPMADFDGSLLDEGPIDMEEDPFPELPY